MASSSSCAVENEDEHLKALYDTFASFCSLEDIAFAYIKARRNVDEAGEILCNAYGNNISDAVHAFSGETKFKQVEDSAENGNLGNFIHLEIDSHGRKPKRVSASVGTVSSVLGKTYVRSNSSLSELTRTSKPLKINVLKSSTIESEVERLGSKLVTEQNLLDDISKKTCFTDVEEFLFAMLGDGFKLSMDSIREVLGNCGYNVKKSMEELLTLSAKTYDNNKTVRHNLQTVHGPNEQTSCYGAESKMLQPQRYSKETSSLENEKTKLSREVLESLFSVPDIYEEEEPKVKRIEWGLNRTRVTGQKPVTKPFEEYDVSPSPITELIQSDRKNDGEDNYQVLRKAANEHWDTMKIYYETAVDAFTKGDHAQANYCLKQGKNFHQMAREADEKSAAMILENSEPDEKDNELSLDLHAQSVNDSVRLLKLHLLSLASIHSFSYLKVTINTDSDSTSRGKRRRKVVLQLLANESIQWSEVEGNPGRILIPLNEIDPSKLSFETL